MKEAVGLIVIEEIVEIHALKLEDCHPSSSFRDG